MCDDEVAKCRRQNESRGRKLVKLQRGREEYSQNAGKTKYIPTSVSLLLVYKWCFVDATPDSQSIIPYLADVEL